MVGQVKRASLSVTGLQYSFDLVMEALGEAVEALCILGGFQPVGACLFHSRRPPSRMIWRAKLLSVSTTGVTPAAAIWAIICILGVECVKIGRTGWFRSGVGPGRPAEMPAMRQGSQYANK